jgi:protein TonB
VLGTLLAYAPARDALPDPVILVDFITPRRADRALEVPVVRKPKRIAAQVPARPDPAAALAVPAEPAAVASTQAPRPQPLPVPAVATVAPPQPLPVPAVAAVSPPEPAPVPVTPPVLDADYLENPPPIYPVLSRRLGEQGRVVLRVLVDPAGRAQEIQVRGSSGHARLDDAALQAVRRWKFLPARRGAEAVAAWVLIPISFRLDS